MRIAVAQRLTLAHGIAGGMEQQAQQLAEGLQRRGHELLVLTAPHPDGRSDGVEHDVRVRYVAPGSWRRYTRRWWAASYTELARQHQAAPFDVLLSQSAGALGYAVRASHELHLPVVIIIHGTLRGALRTQWRSARSPRGLYRLVRLLATLPYHFWLWRRAVPHVARWIAVSQPVAHEWRKELGIPHERIVAIPNGVDTERFRPDKALRVATRARFNIAGDAPLLVAVGRLEHEKGFHLAIEAVQTLQKTFPLIQLFIAGDGVERERLAGMASHVGGAVRLLGYLPQTELSGLLAAADLFLMPTLRDEAFPMTVAEALSSGLPVVASAVGGLPAAIDDRHTGFLVPLGDSAALVRAAATLLSDDERRAAMARAAREDALRRFSQNQMIDATERVLIEASGERA